MSITRVSSVYKGIDWVQDNSTQSRLSTNDHTRPHATKRLVTSGNLRCVDLIKVELCALSTRHEQNWAPRRCNTLPMVAFRHLITAYRVVGILTTAHGSGTHVPNSSPCRMDTAMLVMTEDQRTMHRTGYVQTAQHESTVHHCNCAPVATRRVAARSTRIECVVIPAQSTPCRVIWCSVARVKK